MKVNPWKRLEKNITQESRQRLYVNYILYSELTVQKGTRCCLFQKKKHGTCPLIIQLQTWSVYINTIDTCMFTYLICTKTAPPLKSWKITGTYSGEYQVTQKVHLMSHNTSSIASILKIWPGLDFKLSYHKCLLHTFIELLTNKSAALFWKPKKIGLKEGIKSNKNMCNVKCAITGILICIFAFLIIDTLIKTLKGKFTQKESWSEMKKPTKTRRMPLTVCKYLV